MAEYKFPDGFKWGSATSAHQIEGDNHNDWTEWEKSLPPGFISGKACDSFNRYEEDFDIAKKLNQNIHRFSIEWSRIEPEEGKFNLVAMKHYQGLVKSLRERGIEPMVTLWHFTNPIWFAEKGGFLNKKSPEYFTRYARYVVDNLKSDVHLWITFNEPSIYVGASYVKGIWPPHNKNLLKALIARKNIAEAHILAYGEIKNSYMSHNIMNLVGAVENNVFFIGNKFLRALGIIKFANYFFNLYFWGKTLAYQDFIGLNYYTVKRLGAGKVPKYEVVPEMDWEIYPEGIYHRLAELKKFNKPIIITENGIADAADSKRIKFIKDHLYWIWLAIQDGVDVRGYLYWSLLDNFEWAKGFAPRFGLVEVNYKTFERKIRPSAFEYAKICLENTLKL